MGLDLGEHAFKAVEIQRTATGFEILHAVSVPVPDGVRGGSPAVLGEWLTGVLRRQGFKAAQAVWSVPRHRLILRWLQLPQGTPEEIAQMVRFQAGKDLPLPLEKLRYNYTRVGGDPPVESGAHGKVRILFAAVPSEVADRAAAVVDAAGLIVEGALPSLLASWTLGRATRPDLFPEAPSGADGSGEASTGGEVSPAEPARQADASSGSSAPSPHAVAVIDVGWGSSEVILGLGGEVRYSRSAPVGLSGLAEVLRAPSTKVPAASAGDPAPSTAPETVPTDPLEALRGDEPLPPAAEAWAGQLIAEVSRSIRAWQAELGGADVGAVLLAGGGARLAALRSLLEGELGVPVTPLEPSGGLVGSAVPPASLDPSFASAAGAALSSLSEEAPFLNFLGALEVRRRRLHEVLVVGGIAAAVLLVAGLVTGWILLSGRQAELDLREAQIKELKPRVEQIQQTEKQVALASQWGPDRVPLADLLREITALFPPEAYVTTLGVDESGMIRISGRSKSNQVMSKLVSGLNGSKSFVNAALGAFTKNSDRSEFRYDYTITVQIRSLVPEKSNGDKAKLKT